MWLISKRQGEEAGQRWWLPLWKCWGSYGEAATSAISTLEIIVAKASGRFTKGGHGVELSIATMEALGADREL